MFLSLMLQIDMGYIYTNTSYLRNHPIQKEGKKKKIKKYNFASIDIHFRSTSILEFWFAKKCLSRKKIFYEKWLVHSQCQTLKVDPNPHKLVFNHFSGLLTIIQYHREALSRDFTEISRKFLNSI